MKNRKGFTIVELVIVIAVIAILAAVLIPTFSSVTSSARASAAQQQAKAALDSILALTEGSLPDGTLFCITGDANEGTLDYTFVYHGNKLTQVETKDAEIEKFGKTNEYAIYVTASAFVKAGVDPSSAEAVAAAKNKAAVEKLLANSIKKIAAYADLATVSIDTSSTTNDYYTLTLTAAEGKHIGTEDPANAGTYILDTFRVYYTSDMQETQVVFVGQD